MNLQNIFQKIKLKLEHNPFGTLLLVLFNPFYARPHHFWNAQNSIVGRIGKLLVLAPVLLFYKFGNAITEEVEDYYSTKQVIPKLLGDAIQTAGDTMTWYMVLGMLVGICSFAGIQFGYNKLACSLWKKLGRKVRSAPYDFYLARSASWAAWLGILMFAMLYIYNFGPERAMALAPELIANHPIVVSFLFGGCMVMREIIHSNSFSSSMEIYGSKKIAAINTGVVTVLLFGATYFLSALSRMA